MIGKKKVKLPGKMVERFTEWNTVHATDRDYDERMTVALLLLCTNPNDIVRHAISDEIKHFIKCK